MVKYLQSTLEGPFLTVHSLYFCGLGINGLDVNDGQSRRAGYFIFDGQLSMADH